MQKVKDVCVLTTDKHKDNRGFFRELYKQTNEEYPHHDWFQLNHSRSVKGVIRGIHVAPYPKLVMCMRGEICDIVVDLRKESPTYLKWDAITLKGDKQVFVPAGCGHAFYAEKASDVVYMCGGVYDPSVEWSVRYNDPLINIKWPSKKYILSEKDNNAPFLEDYGKSDI